MFTCKGKQWAPACAAEQLQLPRSAARRARDRQLYRSPPGRSNPHCPPAQQRHKTRKTGVWGWGGLTRLGLINTIKCTRITQAESCGLSPEEVPCPAHALLSLVMLAHLRTAPVLDWSRRTVGTPPLVRPLPPSCCWRQGPAAPGKVAACCHHRCRPPPPPCQAQPTRTMQKACRRPQFRTQPKHPR